MHKLTATIIIVIIFIAIGIVIFSSTGGTPPPTTLPDIQGQGNNAPPAPEATDGAILSEASPSARYERATIVTDNGTIVMTLYPDDAPLTVANFGDKANAGFYNGLTFHRVEDWVVQGGDPLGNGTGGGDIKTELSSRPFVVGSLGVARGGNIEISNDSQFFITTQDADWLNNQYTNFGMVTEGMDIVELIEVGDTITSVTVE